MPIERPNDKEKQDRKVAKIIIDKIGLEKEKYRLGYTKVSIIIVWILKIRACMLHEMLSTYYIHRSDNISYLQFIGVNALRIRYSKHVYLNPNVLL